MRSSTPSRIPIRPVKPILEPTSRYKFESMTPIPNEERLDFYTKACVNLDKKEKIWLRLTRTQRNQRGGGI